MVNKKLKTALAVGTIIVQATSALAFEGPTGSHSGSLRGFSAIAKVNQRVILKGEDGSTRVVDNNAYTGNCFVRYPEISCPEQADVDQQTEPAAPPKNVTASQPAKVAVAATKAATATNSMPVAIPQNKSTAACPPVDNSATIVANEALKSCKDASAVLAAGLAAAQKKVSLLEQQLSHKEATLKAAAALVEGTPVKKVAPATGSTPAHKEAVKKNAVAPAPQKALSAAAPAAVSPVKPVAAPAATKPVAAPTKPQGAPANQLLEISAQDVSKDGIILKLSGKVGAIKQRRFGKGDKVEIEIAGLEAASELTKQAMSVKGGIDQISVKQNGQAAILSLVSKSGEVPQFTAVAGKDSLTLLFKSGKTTEKNSVAPVVKAAKKESNHRTDVRELAAIIDNSGRRISAEGWEDAQVAFAGPKAILRIPTALTAVVDEQLGASTKIKLADGPYTYYVLDKKGLQ